MSDPFIQLETALENEAAEWLRETSPEVYEGVKTALEAGKTPSQIYFHTLYGIGESRRAFARRVQLAAKAIVRGE